MILANDDSRDLLSVQKTLRGDAQAFADIVGRYSPILYSLSFRFLGDEQEAEDAVQEIFVRAFRSLPRFNLRARFYSWIYTIGLNWLRSRLRATRTARKYVGPPIGDDEPVDIHGADPSDALIRREEERLIHTAIGQLPLLYREVFALRYLEGLPLDEIAAILKISPGTVRVRLHRAKKRMIEIITEQGQK